ncbi:NnrS family protein [Alkalimarinus coralli]|uniref:NnrS family protein n=1 Tax=Alkalimarinus coralli TaxID=2935863 RepID=UPI00202AF838|nr:NnrS family protein [Alkalimarinus coralli]
MSNVDNMNAAMAIPPILRLAFRPLFLGGTLFSIIALCWWAYFWVAPFDWQPYGGPVWWHGHEMLFGFGAAIVVGFLLTAVQSWTGVPGLKGNKLAVLALAWLLGRLFIAFGGSLPGWLVAVVDLSFLLLSAMAMAYPVLKVKQWRNLMFVPILLVLMILNGVSHWGVLTDNALTALHSLHGAILLIALVVSIIGGRVIPFFTANASSYTRLPNIGWLDGLSIGSIIALVVIGFVGFSVVPQPLLAVLSLLAAVSNGWRFMRWGIAHTLSTPLLWSLHFSYLFVPVGMIALFLYSMGWLGNISIALHCLTVGAMGGMILAMISRVTLGHTGRKLQPPKLMTLGYILILTAAVVRVLLPWLVPPLANWGIVAAAVLWVAAYSIYLRYYGPMLVTTRADGRPG